MINTHMVFCFEVWLEHNPHCHIYHRENLVFTGTIEMLDTEGFLKIRNSLISPAGIPGHLQGRTQQIILPEQQNLSVKRLFLLQSSRLQGIFLISVLSPPCAWNRDFFIPFVLNQKTTMREECGCDTLCAWSLANNPEHSFYAFRELVWRVSVEWENFRGHDEGRNICYTGINPRCIAICDQNMV